MIRRVDQFFAGKALNDDQRRLLLRQTTANYVIYGDLEMALRLFNDWNVSNRVVWPYPGGRLNQPQWVTGNFETLEMLSELFKLEKKLPRADGLPTEEELGL